MSSTLSEGVRVPDIGSVNWGADVNFNWGLLNTCLANISSNVKVDAENTWTAPQTFTETISGSIDGVAARAVGDEDGNNIKAALAGKQPSLSQSQLDAVNSGITAAAVQQISTNADTIATKAADNAVVHLAGAETITGNKTWTGLNTYQRQITLKDNAAIPAGGYGVGLDFYDYAGNRYGYIQPHVTSGGTKNMAFGNSAGGYLEFASSPVPYASGILPLGTSTFRWNGIYDANSIFVYNGYIFGTTPTTSKYWGLWCRDNAGVEVADFLSCARTSGHNSAWIRCLNTDGTNTYDRHIELAVGTDGVTQFIPNSSGAFDLGRTSAKWKTFNGINPGALSFPSASTVDLSGSITDLNGGINEYTPAVDGWVQIVVPNAADAYLSVRSYYQPYSGGCVMGNSSTLDRLCITVPVRSGIKHVIYVKAASITSAVFRPCQGNV